MSTKSRLPHHWPPNLQYLDALTYHSSVPADIRSIINPGLQRSGLGAHASRSSVAIRPIVDPAHPANGQSGLFATKKIPPRTHILYYLGEVHCDDRPESDYDLSLYRTRTGVSVGVDASRMGNEARFINDFRGVKLKPNAVLKDQRIAAGEFCIGIWSGTEVIKKGEEILISYGKGFWKGRNPPE